MRAILKCVVVAAVVLGGQIVSGEDTLSAAAPRQTVPGGISIIDNLVKLVDGHVQASVDALKQLAATDDVQSGDWSKINDALLAAQAKMSATVLWYGYPDGSYAVAGKGMTTMNVRDRGYFAEAMAGRVSVGELVISRASGKKSCIVAVPVIKSGKVRGFLGASLYLEDFSTLTSTKLGLPGSQEFVAMDRDGQITLSKTPSRIFTFMYEGAGEDVAQALDRILTQAQGVAALSVGGKPQRVTFGSCAVVPWKVMVVDSAAALK